MNHIQSFPLKISHYSSKEIKYIDVSLNVKVMFELFKKKIFRSQIFVLLQNSDYHFGRSQIDTCECERLTLKLKDNNLNAVVKHVATV